MRARIVAWAVLAALVCGPAVAQDREAALGSLDFRRVVAEAKAKVFPAVVYIKCVRESHEQGERKSQVVGGSGVIISASGEVLTNWHVVDKATAVRCLLSDGRALSADIVGTDKSVDLALIRLREAADLPVAEFGDSAVLTEGDFVMAMGAPWGLSRSVSIGIVSCTRRYLPEVSEYSLWLQTDAAISPGNSGGPLVNTDGRIIGINTRGMDRGGDMGFAVPSETIGYLLPQLREHGRVDWSWTGLQLQPIRDFEKDMYFEGSAGVIVAETDPESPARRAGFQARDRILKVGGTPLGALTREDIPAVNRVLGLLPKHEAARFEVLRGPETLTLEVTPREKGRVEGEELDCPRWDLTVKTINQFDNPNLYFYRKEGVFVFGVKHPGNASTAGLRDSDIITKIGGREIASLADVTAAHTSALDNLADEHKVVFTVMRGGLVRQIVLDFSRDYSRE